MKFEDIYIYGEVLFDCFGNGNDKLGGAPFNVAWNLKGFGLEPKFLSAIGKDELGDKVLSTMKNWGLVTSYINIINDKSTGSVNVHLEDGIPEYFIQKDSAYDQIDVHKDIKSNAILYHGSLALRYDFNQKKCKELKKQVSNTFSDINLRTPWWDSFLLQNILIDLNWLKINDEELPLLCDSFSFNKNDEIAQLEFIQKKLDLELIILTKGSNGALLLDKDKQIIEMPVVKVDKMNDTVGAGDAFASVVIYGLYNGWDKKLILQRAMAFASKVCTLNGAITGDKGFYNSFVEQWS